MTRAESIVAGLASVRRRIADAARAAGRAPESVRLVAVSKRMPAADIAVALAAGQVDFGENYAQELRDKRATFEATPPPGGAAPAWHFIGPLQTNKVKYVAGNVALIHSIHVATLAHVRCVGLMLIPPLAAPATTRHLFAALRALRDQQAAITRPRVDLRELSMGMSNDFEVAIAEGATLVRVGTSIFGARPPAAVAVPVSPAT